MGTMTVYDWFTYGDRGMSSEALMRHLFKTPDPLRSTRDATAFPYDPDDLRRCRLALEQTGTLARIGEAAAISKTWAALVGKWDVLCATMDEEAPDWRDGKGDAPNTYAMMTKIRDEARP